MKRAVGAANTDKTASALSLFSRSEQQPNPLHRRTVVVGVSVEAIDKPPLKTPQKKTNEGILFGIHRFLLLLSQAQWPASYACYHHPSPTIEHRTTTERSAWPGRGCGVKSQVALFLHRPQVFCCCCCCCFPFSFSFFEEKYILESILLLIEVELVRASQRNKREKRNGGEKKTQTVDHSTPHTQVHN